ncbi:hypothetical protein GALMADRAFT_256837 [Galerina marginata CBS 339.88]|uniref:C2H2-type domain-containing protein n=1 Tax=Galerina marginata (strain CBS 339.88) TaxID=685588 RepID=A0A067SLK0_GALM3|nr:hypothetical protein GALMADRAFT_256837 [Galerina marginata CBS 339.88]
MPIYEDPVTSTMFFEFDDVISHGFVYDYSHESFTVPKILDTEIVDVPMTWDDSSSDTSSEGTPAPESPCDFKFERQRGYSDSESENETRSTKQSWTSTARNAQDVNNSSIPAGTAIRRVIRTARGVLATQAKQKKPAKFECEFCLSRLTTKFRLDTHRKAHLGINDHHCDFCSYETPRRSDAVRHMRSCLKAKQKLVGDQEAVFINWQPSPL